MYNNFETNQSHQTLAELSKEAHKNAEKYLEDNPLPKAN
jgi:hypothetical protein